MRLKLTIAYDGRPFNGWQIQPGVTTVQETLQKTASDLGAAEIAMHGSGRTDTGVHALGQVAHFDSPAASHLAPADWKRALNAKLPPSIRIVQVEKVAPDFHARFDAIQKEYRYLIDSTEVLLPLRHGQTWHLSQSLDRAKLSEVSRIFIGTHDFRNFAANRGEPGEQEPRDPARTTRTISDVTVLEPAAGRFEIRFRGNGFLYKMVRLLTGSAVRCALGKADPAWLRETLEAPGPATSKSHHLAPAEGLYLARVEYPGKS